MKSLHCTGCKAYKPIDAFDRDEREPDGIAYYCQDCSKRIKYIDFKQRIYRQYASAKNRARTKKAEDTFTLREWERMLDESQGNCYYCGDYQGITRLCIEHKVPFSKGGSNTKENITPACTMCNRRKQYHVIRAPNELPPTIANHLAPPDWTASSKFQQVEKTNKSIHANDFAVLVGREAIAYSSRSPEEALTRARLIAAAPDLLKACSDALSLITGPDRDVRLILESAINKAMR